MGVVVRMIKKWIWGEDCSIIVLVKELVLKFGVSYGWYGGIDLNFLG